MKSITPLSQNDSRWKNEKLGFGNTTIGNYGCLITALTCLARIDDVKVVNNVLKENKGYVGDNGNLVVWSAVSKIPGLTFNYKYYTYDNNKVKEIIARDGGCIIEVDGAPIGGHRHWLLFIGDGKLIDTWDGKIKATSSYKAISFVDISYKEGEPMSDPLKECLAQHAHLMNEIKIKDEKIKTLEGEKKALEDLLTKKNEEINSLVFNGKELVVAIEKAQKDLASEVGRRIEADIEVNELRGELESVKLALVKLTEENSSLNKTIEALKYQIEVLQDEIGTPVDFEDSFLTKIADWIKKILGKLK